jgi:hypothetical protein
MFCNKPRNSFYYTWIVVIFVIEEDSFFNDDFFLGIADVDQAEGVVGKLKNNCFEF